MRNIKVLIASFFGMLFFATSAFAYYAPKEKSSTPANNQTVTFREQCVTANEQIDQDVNNVRARLTTGGDVWWNRNDGKYVVPKVDPGQQEVSSIFAGAVWLGGVDPGGNLKVACQTYGNANGQSDFWPGPLIDGSGTTDKVLCDQWERFFEVSGQEVQEHLALFEAKRSGTAEYTADMVPKGLKEWPAVGNPFFFSEIGFDLPFTTQGLAGFFDENDDGIYNPLDGDFPTIEIRGCEEFPPQFPDEMIFWIYNDEGGGAIHGESMGIPIRMEVQVQAFGYATNDEINNMTFQRYKLINRASEDIDSTYFAMWVDPDLGCYVDDYIGCDVERSLGYTYNEDAVDGDAQCTGIGVYGENVPIIGVDYFRGPLNEFREELGMSTFTYYNNGTIGTPPPGTTDPGDAQDFYNYLTGTWLDGTPFTFGGNAYNAQSTNFIDYAFVDPPNDPEGWSMCTEDLPFGDRRTIQASGPFKLQPGAVNELIIGAVWVPDLPYPCPSIKALQDADDISQDLFDNCFDILDGPDAPDVDWVELDQELIAVFTNKPFPASNNANETYEEAGVGFPRGVDSTYNFEGYLLYQLAGPNVDLARDIDNPEQVRLIYQVDVRNGINTLYNWISVENPNFDPTDQESREFVFYPEVQAEGADEGIRHTFSIKEDQFGVTDQRLINHRRYYFTALAYAHNEYEPFDAINQTGQAETFVIGRKNIRTYGPIPRPIIDRELNSSYGEGPVITRIDGRGVGGNFIDIAEESMAEIVAAIRAGGSYQGEITYQNGKGPIDVRIYNPIDVVDGEFELTFIDENMNNDELDNEVFWLLTDLATGEQFQSGKTLDTLNEEIFGQYGFTVTIGQTDDVGEWADPTDGAIGYEQTYGSPDQPFWFSGVPNGLVPTGLPPFVANFFTFIDNREDWDDREHEVLGNIGPGYFVPYQVARFQQELGGAYLTPAWRAYGGGLGTLVMDEDRIRNLNNVDIVFTSDKELWSRCMVVETMMPEYEQFPYLTDGQQFIRGENLIGFGDKIEHFDLRGAPSVDKNGNPSTTPGDYGMGWFPGYAIDVETGNRLNIFFGENSAYRQEVFGDVIIDELFGGSINGADMIFNPEDQLYVDLGVQNLLSYYVGGQHWVFVTNTEYDECETYRPLLDPANPTLIRKRNALRDVTWAGLPLPQPGMRFTSIEEGLIPNDVTVKMRVDNPYDIAVGTNEFNGYPTYRFKIEGKEASELDAVGVENALDAINVVPNPYYAYSDYENATNTTLVKITNLPAKCVVTIYSLDGKFIRQYNRDEQPGNPFGSGINNSQVIPDLEWDLKNNKGIPIAAGVYLIHVNSDLGERTIKWFGINRKFDPAGL